MGVVKNEQTSGTLGRGIKMGRLGFSLVGSYLGYQAQNLLYGESKLAERQSSFHRNISRKVREELGALKGPAMKLGQVLSMQTEALPEEALQELAHLQMQAPGMHASLVRAQFKSALGRYPEDVFRRFEPEPFAAASLGQVHRAITQSGEKVAVKIQYPAIRSAIESDFKLLRSATLPTRITGHIPTALVDEIQRGLLEETDYLREADNLDFFRQGLAHLPYVTIPRVHRELTADRVLTMSFIEGETFSNLQQRKLSQALRDQVGARLVETFETQLRLLKRLHADYHPGNFLLLPEGGIGMVDFGCIKHISFDVTELRRGYRERVWRKSETAARNFLSYLYGPGVPYARARRSLPIMERWADLVYPPNSTADLAADFGGDSALMSKLKKIGMEHQRQVLRDKLINPDLAFVTRADMGLRYFLCELGAKVNLTKIWDKVAAQMPNR